MKTIEINSLEEIKKAAQSFIAATQGHRQFAFYGPMGSGKTTLIKAICAELGATGLVTSPTFSLVNEYALDDGQFLYHFDLYRINTLNELFDIGYEEYFLGDHYVFIEWAEKAEALLPESAVHVKLEEIDHAKRLISIAL
jgi:tRNA threonylcarbamoyladenosine biosynthesis protein TsaE